MPSPLPQTLYAEAGYAGATALYDRPRRRMGDHIITLFRTCAEGEVIEGGRYVVTWAAAQASRVAA